MSVTFSGKYLRSFSRRQKAALLWRLSFKTGSFAKDCLQPLVNKKSLFQTRGPYHRHNQTIQEHKNS